MPLFQSYQPSFIKSREYVLRTLRLGLIPIGVALVVMWERAQPPGPGLWSALGVCLGMESMLFAAWRFRDPGIRKTRLGMRMAVSLDRWFPLLVFSAQSVFLIVTVLIFWLTIVELGLEIYRWIHPIIYVLLFYVPLRRFMLEYVREKSSKTAFVVRESLNYLAVILIALLAGSILTMVVIPLGHPLTGDTWPPLIFIWVLVVMTILSVVVLFVDRVFSSRKKRMRQT